MPPKMGVLKPFQLLEVNIISAQDLEPISKKMKTYASAWVHPTRKLTTGVDNEGGNNPTWNDKFVFRVDEEFLQQDTSAVQIDIFSAHWFRDSLLGSVRILVGNLIPPPTRLQHQHHIGMRFVALQVCFLISIYFFGECLICLRKIEKLHACMHAHAPLRSSSLKLLFLYVFSTSYVSEYKMKLRNVICPMFFHLHCLMFHFCRKIKPTN